MSLSMSIHPKYIQARRDLKLSFKKNKIEEDQSPSELHMSFEFHRTFCLIYNTNKQHITNSTKHFPVFHPQSLQHNQQFRHLHGSVIYWSNMPKYFGHCLQSTWIGYCPNSRQIHGTHFHYSRY